MRLKNFIGTTEMESQQTISDLCTIASFQNIVFTSALPWFSVVL